MAKKKKKIKPVENPFDLNIKEQVKETFTVDPNAKKPKLGQTFPGSIITGVKTIVNLPAIAAKNAQRLAYNLTGNSEAANEVRPLYKFTNENVINGMQGLEAPYRRITEPIVANLIAAQQMFRNPRAHFLNPSKVFETFNRSYLAAQGNRENLEWYRNAANPVTLGQAFNAVLANHINNPEIPDLLDSEAVQKYYVYDPRSEYMDLVNPTPGKTASGAVDFMALIVLDPLNWIPGPKGIQKLTTAGKAAENTVDWSAKGLKQLKPGDIKRIVEQADAAGREDLADFVLLLDEIGNDNANKLIDSYVFYGTPEFKETASYVKNFFYDYESIAKELPGEDIARIEGLGDVKYFVQDGDVFAASDETILKWVYPYTNSKGKTVEGYWRESLLFPRTTIDEAQLRLGNDIGEIEDVQFVDEVVQSGKNIQAPAGSAIQKKHLGSVFQHSLTPLIRRTGNSKLASTDLTLPVNALELRIASGNTVLNEWLKSANTSFAVFYIGGKRQVVAYDKVSQKFYTLDSARVKYKPKEVEESQDVLTRITNQDEDLLDAPKLSFRKAQQLVKQLKDGTIKPADLELYKSALGSRYINNELSKRELDLLNTLDGRSAEQLNLLEKVNAELAAEGLAPIGRGIETLDAYKTQRQINLESEGQPTDDYLEDFYKLLTEAPEGTFDEYGDLADLSAFTSAEAKLSDGATISGPLETPKVKRGKRELLWREQPNFRIDDAEGYEVLYHSPIDGSIMAAIVPDNFIIVKPGLDAMGRPQLPLLKRVDRIPTSSIKSPGTVSGEGFYTFDTAGQVVPLGQAKSSYDRLRETLVRASMRVQENKEAAIRRVIKDVRIKSQGKNLDDLIAIVQRQIDEIEPEYLKVKSLEREINKKTSGGFLNELTPEEFAAYKIINKYNRLTGRRQDLLEEASVIDQLPKTPTENGFYFKVTRVDDQVSIDLIRRTLDWDSYDVLSRQLVRPQLDEVIGSWKMTKYELNKVNFLSQKMGGYTTDWDLFRALNSGDEDLYTLNANEVANFAGRKFKGKKAFRIRDYRRTINKLRKERGAEPFKSQEDFTYGYDELIKEQARAEWLQANKALNWAKSVLDNPNASAKNKAYAQKLFDDMTEKIVEIEDQLAKDVNLIDRIIAQEILPEQLDPGIWWRIYGEVPKPEKYLESFLRALNEARGTKVALEDDAIKTLDNLDNPYPVKEVDEWSDDPISMNNAEDGPLPEGVFPEIEKALSSPKSGISNQIYETIETIDDVSFHTFPEKEYQEIIDSIYKKEDLNLENGIYTTYKIGKQKIVFKGYNQDLPNISGIQIVPTTPIGILEQAIKLNPENNYLKTLLENFKSKKFGEEENLFLDKIVASISVGKNGKEIQWEDPDGFALLLSALSGNSDAQKVLDEKVFFFNDILKQKEIQRKSILRSEREELRRQNPEEIPETIDETQLPVFHSTEYDVIRNDDGTISLFPYGQHTLGTDVALPRASLHFTLAAPVESHTLGHWAKSQNKIVTNFSSMVSRNNTPHHLRPSDTWWLRSPGEPLIIENASVIRPFVDEAKYRSELVKRGLIAKNDELPVIIVDPKTKDVLHTLKKDYTLEDRIQISNIARQADVITVIASDGTSVSLLNPELISGYESIAIERISMQLAKKQLGIETPPEKMTTFSLLNKRLENSILYLAEKYDIPYGIHMGSGPEILEKGMTSNRTKFFGESIQAIRFAALMGRFDIDIKSLYDDIGI